MKRTRSIALLITSSVILTACHKNSREDAWGGEESPTPTPSPSSPTGGAHTSAVIYIHSSSTGEATEEGASEESVSRGGFGESAGGASGSE